MLVCWPLKLRESLSDLLKKGTWLPSFYYQWCMYCDIHRYNVEALHTKMLREEELERASAMAHHHQQQQQQNPDVNSTSTVLQLAKKVAVAQQAIHAMQQQRQLMQQVIGQQQHHQHLQHQSDSSMLVQNVVLNIDRTLRRINELHSLHLEKKMLVEHYGEGSLPPEGEGRKRYLDKQLQQGYSHLSKDIQFANESINCFNKSPAAQVHHLLHVVSFKRQQLSAQLEQLKNCQGKSMGGAAPPTGSSQGGSSGHAVATGHGGSSSSASAEVSSSTLTKRTDPNVKERLIALVAESNEEKQMRETAKELLVKKTKAPADSSTNPGSNAKKN